MWGFTKGGKGWRSGGKKRKTMNAMSSSCSRGESLQSPVLIPPDALDALIYIVEKKLTELPVEGPSTAAWLPDELSHDSTSGRKRAEKYTPKAQE